uniref:Titin n=1 Tax=Strigops habroptila TaxID=2489341 RepID=A0A672TI17_STRHB
MHNPTLCERCVCVCAGTHRYIPSYSACSPATSVPLTVGLCLLTEPAVFVKKLSDFSVEQGKSIVLESSYTGTPPISVTWKRNGMLIAQSPRCSVTTTDKSGILEIFNSTKNDEGEYTCEVANEAGGDVCHSLVSILEPLILKCQIGGAPEIKVSWYKDDAKLRSTQAYKMHFKNNVATLAFSTIEDSDIGEYICKAENSVGFATSTALLVVKGDRPRATLSRGKRQLPPTFSRKLKDIQETLKGSDIHLECELQGTPPFQISWYKDKREIRSSKKYKVMSENYLASIHILSVDTADVGEYHCKAVNDVGSDSCIGSVTLRGLYKDWHLLGIALFLSFSSYFLGSSAVLECKVYGSPPILVSWFHDGEEIISGDKYQATLTDNTCSLKVNGLQESDMGTYLCTASNVAGSDECSAFLSVREPPYFITPLEPVQVTVGDSASLQCQVAGTPEMIVSWYKGDTKLRGTAAMKMHFKNQVATLVFSQVDSSDKGKTLPFFDIPITPVDGIIGESADFECHISGTQPIKVTWAKDNQEIRTGRNYQLSYVDNTAHLTILRVDRGDSGQYTCYASNEVGKESCTAQLTVKDVPGPVRNLEVTEIYDGEVSLAWQEPESDGGSKIIGYVVERRDIKRKTWIMVTDRAENSVLTDVVENEEYFFRVRAQNMVGVGKPSPATRAVKIMDPISKYASTECDCIMRQGHFGWFYVMCAPFGSVRTPNIFSLKLESNQLKKKKV